jgi:PAS domain S-box-containing protein
LYSEIIHQRNFVEDIFNYMLNGVITIDGRGNITSYNHAAGAILDIRQKAPFPQHRLDVFTSNLDTIKTVREQLLSNGKYSGYNIKIISNGQTKYLNINASLIRKDGSPPDGIIILEDVSEKKQLDDQIQHLEKLASLGRFAASIAHEIRNPLTGISLFLDNLHDRTAGQPEISLLVEKALSEIERLEKLTHEILVYTHPSSGVYTENDINKTIQNILYFIEPQCKNNKIKVSCNLNSKLPVFYFNVDRIRQALLNIFLNAIQAMPDGGEIEVTTELQENILNKMTHFETINETKYAKICIEDSGPGISKSEREKIFEPFYSAKKQGSGLGLSTTYNIISEHKGTVEVGGMEGSGAVFTVYLPIIESYVTNKKSKRSNNAGT